MTTSQWHVPPAPYPWSNLVRWINGGGPPTHLSRSDGLTCEVERIEFFRTPMSLRKSAAFEFRIKYIDGSIESYTPLWSHFQNMPSDNWNHAHLNWLMVQCVRDNCVDASISRPKAHTYTAPTWGYANTYDPAEMQTAEKQLMEALKLAVMSDRARREVKDAQEQQRNIIDERAAVDFGATWKGMDIETYGAYLRVDKAQWRSDE